MVNLLGITCMETTNWLANVLNNLSQVNYITSVETTTIFQA